MPGISYPIPTLCRRRDAWRGDYGNLGVPGYRQRASSTSAGKDVGRAYGDDRGEFLLLLLKQTVSDLRRRWYADLFSRRRSCLAGR